MEYRQAQLQGQPNCNGYGLMQEKVPKQIEVKETGEADFERPCIGLAF